jgi:hypothetical protein
MIDFELEALNTIYPHTLIFGWTLKLCLDSDLSSLKIHCRKPIVDIPLVDAGRKIEFGVQVRGGLFGYCSEVARWT